MGGPNVDHRGSPAWRRVSHKRLNTGAEMFVFRVQGLRFRVLGIPKPKQTCILWHTGSCAW